MCSKCVFKVWAMFVGQFFFLQEQEGRGRLLNRADRDRGPVPEYPNHEGEKENELSIEQRSKIENRKRKRGTLRYVVRVKDREQEKSENLERGEGLWVRLGNVDTK